MLAELFEQIPLQIQQIAVSGTSSVVLLQLNSGKPLV